MAYVATGQKLAANKASISKAQAIVNAGPMQRNDPTYHDKAQIFIKGAKDKGYAVSAEGEELIAAPQQKAKPVTPVMRAGRMARDAAGLIGKVATKIATDPLNVRQMKNITR